MQKMKPVLSALLCFPAAAAAGGVIPQTVAEDGRIQTVRYSPDAVVEIRARIGQAVLVQLEEGESLSGDTALVGMGNAQAWNLAVRGNNILFKPTHKAPQTNLIVVSDRRTYVFRLSLGGGRYCSKYGKKGCIRYVQQPPTYYLRFEYPSDNKPDAAAILAGKWNAAGKLRNPPRRLNYDYWGKGDRVLQPTAVYDDGLMTTFVYNNAKELPSFYAVDQDGKEMLLNKHIEGDKVIVHQVHGRFMLRLERAVLQITNRSFDGNGFFNTAGTAAENDVRLIKEGNNR